MYPLPNELIFSTETAAFLESSLYIPAVFECTLNLLINDAESGLACALALSICSPLNQHESYLVNPHG